MSRTIVATAAVFAQCRTGNTARVTFGAGGAGAALLLLVVLAALGAVFVIGLIVLAMAWSARSRTMAWVGTTLVALPFVLVLGAVTWARITADPDTLELDLRHQVAETDLPGDKFPGFPAYDIDSDRVDLRLAHGDRLASRVDVVSVWVHDGRATSVDLRRDATTLAGLRAQARRWAQALGLPVRGLAAATADWSHKAGQEWKTSGSGRRVSLDITGEGSAIVWASVAVPDG